MYRGSTHKILVQVVSVLAVMSVVMVLLMMEQGSGQPPVAQGVRAVPCGWSGESAGTTTPAPAADSYIIVNGRRSASVVTVGSGAAAMASMRSPLALVAR